MTFAPVKKRNALQRSWGLMYSYIMYESIKKNLPLFVPMRVIGQDNLNIQTKFSFCNVDLSVLLS